jgi:hypothetical protein
LVKDVSGLLVLLAAEEYAWYARLLVALHSPHAASVMIVLYEPVSMATLNVTVGVPRDICV